MPPSSTPRKNCDEPLVLELGAQKGFGAPDRVQVSASIREPEAKDGGKPFLPVEYTWTFGDGKIGTTTAPFVEHSYEGRSQNSLESSYVIGVKARDAGGRIVEGHSSVTLSNPGYMRLAIRGEVDVQVGATAASDHGARELWLYHGRPGSIRIESITMQEIARHAEPAGPIPQSPTTLGFTEIPPGRSISVANVERLAPRRPRRPGCTESTGARRMASEPWRRSRSHRRRPERK